VSFKKLASAVADDENNISQKTTNIEIQHSSRSTFTQDSDAVC
jgi:hypothetical protein